MIVVFLKSGLGNQMFEYAFAKILARNNSEKIVFNLQYLKKDKDGRDFELNQLGIAEEIHTGLTGIVEYIYYRMRKKIMYVLLKRKRIDERRHIFMRNGIYINYRETGVFDDFKWELSHKKVKYVEGYFETHKLWGGDYEYVKDIYKNFRVTTKIKKYIHLIQNSESVCIHVRLGDYITNKKWRDALFVCTPKYYELAQEEFRDMNNPIYFVFTNSENDIKWIKSHIRLKGKVNYVVGNSGVEDLYLMTLCKHFIISNSTFSWWAQFLAENSNKRIIAPSKWSRTDDTHNIYMQNWKLIEV